MKKKIIGALGAAALVFALAACEEGTASDKAYDEIAKEASGRQPYKPQNDVEYNNYNKAQELYDDPSSIIWCTTTWGNASAPLVTVPVAGKLTSSSVSYFPNYSPKWSNNNGGLLVENRSVDGMYHGNPPGYRYGFTPGGQYVDFFNMPTVCTTALTEFQRQSTEVSISNDDVAAQLQQRAEDALKAGNADEAQKILEEVAK
ncbi:hypothetical protein [Puerhibacterium puerhi]|uniref:hypothetical protein n=1 Tax=Puerhibacterium puerhi TaxID=2692623 RepID=UPI001359EBD8|nr:hypothetical protein [Puerhibacterium puerhi]